MAGTFFIATTIFLPSKSVIIPPGPARQTEQPHPAVLASAPNTHHALTHHLTVHPWLPSQIQCLPSEITGETEAPSISPEVWGRLE